MPLNAEKIGFFYRRNKWIFRDVDFTIEPGEVVGLVGPSGRGKTTFAQILSGYIDPKEGAVSIDGQPLPATGYHPVQLVYQHPERAVNPKWRMEQTLYEGWKPDREQLDQLGIKQEWLKRWPNELSGGELQRFCVARALGPDTRYLIADEMTTMLDAITQAQIWHTVLDHAKKRQIGLLIISHDPSLMKRICNRIIDFS